jgi:uncharacterized damage-inducible protein DinB
MSVPVATLINHFDYTNWATSRLLDSCHHLDYEELTRDLGVSHTSVLHTLQHIYYADRVWLARLEGRVISFADEGDGPSLTDLSNSWPALLKQFRDYVEGLTEVAANEIFHYKNLKGEEFTLKRWQAILHVVNHASIHRGQVVAMIRQLGKEPCQTDLIYYYLQN